jgi:hypothetical protein
MNTFDVVAGLRPYESAKLPLTLIKSASLRALNQKKGSTDTDNVTA